MSSGRQPLSNRSFGNANWANNSYRQWLKIAQVAQPANFWVFIEEHPDSINDGVFINDPGSVSSWDDIPAAYHNGSATLSFADLHVEPHKWLSNTTKRPVRFFYSTTTLDLLGRTDYTWLMSRSAVKFTN